MNQQVVEEVIEIAREPLSQERGRPLRRGHRRGRGRGGERQVMPCSLYFDPRILVCPYGDMCRDAHVLKAARETRERASSTSSQESNQGRQRRNETRFTPAYNPLHPDAKKAASGNGNGQENEATSVPRAQPQAQAQVQMAAQDLGSDSDARARINEILTQHSSAQAQTSALEDPEWRRKMETAEEALKQAYISKGSSTSDPMLKKKQA